MVSDEELIYLYRQGNDWALKDLSEKYDKIISKAIVTYKKSLENLVFDQAECWSQAQMCFYKSIDYYCETKDASFATYFFLKLQFTLKNYLNEVYQMNRYEKSYDAICNDEGYLRVEDRRYHPKVVLDLQNHLEELKEIAKKAKGMERNIIDCLLQGYSAKEMADVLPYDTRTIHNGLYRIRKKLRISGQ